MYITTSMCIYCVNKKSVHYDIIPTVQLENARGQTLGIGTTKSYGNWRTTSLWAATFGKLMRTHVVLLVNSVVTQHNACLVSEPLASGTFLSLHVSH